MSGAQRSFREDAEKREQAHAILVQEIYSRLPRVEEIDREMRATVGTLMVAALDS